ncbi:hypothetical protein [Flaviaesturariibacter amylovorans]|uniref:Uncharacterized protein n=1 Tax=Flaviaesturariibacter amylovorans TaxID=1084520 RepID=A0ABP8HJG5_9BACT
MKKLFSLLLCATLFGSAFAQSDRERSRDVIFGKGGSTSTGSTSRTTPRDVILGGNGSNRSTGNSCQDQINALNRTYDNQVRTIQNNPLLSSAEKAKKIRETNEARRFKIAEARRACNADRRDDRRYDRRDRDDARDDDRNYAKTRKVKGNNGNHYGWDKGKGNPHRNGGKPGKGNNGNGKNKNK